MSKPIIKDENFIIGCNYWASHAGTHMWSDWRPEIVEADLKKLSEKGLKVLRVFPLWPYFQPIEILWSIWQTPYEYTVMEKRDWASTKLVGQE